MTRITLLSGCLLSLALCAPAHSQIQDLRMPVTIDAESTKYDGKTSMLEFTGLRLTQGDISIEAETARASRMDFDDSVWNFRGDVVFDLAEGRITCESASLEFRDFTLMRARIEGAPATFRFRRRGSDETTYGEAEKLDYNVPDGLVEFSGDAVINEGGNRISSESLVYNIVEQRINAVSSGDGDGRVKVTYMPPGSDADDEAAAEEPASGAEVPAPESGADPSTQPSAQEPEPADTGAPPESAGDDRENNRGDGSGGG
jgi:lipopolysaccharide export system protein LptA